ncbi:hypothetical protein TNCV_5017861 [Trichonephila clavipes]|nr:hypothetical protein TNCV_5017861 [Trichonephila clavipes]
MEKTPLDYVQTTHPHEDYFGLFELSPFVLLSKETSFLLPQWHDIPGGFNLLKMPFPGQPSSCQCSSIPSS